MESQLEVYDLQILGSFEEKIEIQPSMQLSLGRKMKIRLEDYDLPTPPSYMEEIKIQPVINDRKSQITMESIRDSFSSLFIPKESRSPREIMDRKNQMKMEDIDDDKSGMSLTLNEEIAFEKQQRFDQNHYPSHGTKFFKRTLSLFIVFLQCAGGTVLENSEQERQALSDIYQSTLAEVSTCPTRSDFDERSYNRCANVCEFDMQEGCAYHCMRDSSKTRLVEFCAKPKILFIYCPEYDPVDQTIQKDEDTLCNSTSSTIFFLSSNIFKCDPNSCFQINERTVRTDATTLTTLTIKPLVRNSGKIQQTLCTGLLVFVVMTMYT